jgi:UDP-glucose 4-epimerase
MKSLIERTPPNIYGDGEQSRDFTYVDDVAALCIKAARAQGVAGKVYNAGNGNRYTLNYAWELLQKTEGISLPAIYEAPRQGDVRDSQADVTRAVAELGHSPQFSFEEGLRLTLDWYRSQGANNSVA